MLWIMDKFVDAGKKHDMGRIWLARQEQWVRLGVLSPWDKPRTVERALGQAGWALRAAAGLGAPKATRKRRAAGAVNAPDRIEPCSMQGKQRATAAGLGAGKEADGGRSRRWGPRADDVTDASEGARCPRPWLLSCATKRRQDGGNQ